MSDGPTDSASSAPGDTRAPASLGARLGARMLGGILAMMLLLPVPRVIGTFAGTLYNEL